VVGSSNLSGRTIYLIHKVFFDDFDRRFFSRNCAVFLETEGRGDERVDFIYASRPAARGLLEHATAIQTAFGEVRVVSTEGLIGLKLQGFVNNPRRTQDLEDIKALIAANRQALKMDEVREYFRLFNREVLLEEILK
jgi:hypothetical protein